MGYPVSLPVFICPAALARLGHPEGLIDCLLPRRFPILLLVIIGEVNIVQAAAKEGVAQGVRCSRPTSPD